MNIAVLSGGLSPERDVALSSGAMAANALMSRGHRVCFVDLFLGMDDVPADPLSLFRSDLKIESFSISSEAPDLEKLRASRNGGFSDWIGTGVLEICRAADITYLALHGGDGENGRLQAFLDMNGIRYTGSGFFGCAIAMDKWVTKQLLLGNGVSAPKGALLRRGEPVPAFPLPCVVKPCCGGSSIGIAIARNEAEYTAAVTDAFRYEDAIILEEYIRGTELTCGVLGGEPLPLTEIIPNEDFYDYAHKYQSGWTQEITPARISPEATARVREQAVRVFRALHLDTYARVDFLLAEDGTPYCLEANTLPGMTPTSLLPQGAAEAGIDYPALCEKIVTLSLEKYKA